MAKTNFLFVVGGVMSSIGKGVTVSNIAKLLADRNFNVSCVKIDPYINVDAGTMNPLEHGEVFVTKDGIECDQDIGNYERFLNKDLSSRNYITTGLIYKSVIDKERSFKYNGKCVEVVPDITNEIIQRINDAAKKDKADFLIVEIGGTVGEYQNLIFLEAARIMKLKNPKNVGFVLVSYLPIPDSVGEMKTKPTQYAVRSLNMAGIQPDFIVGRSKREIDEKRKSKLSVSCNIKKENVISAPDVKNIYSLVKYFEKDKFAEKILKHFNKKPIKKVNNKDWYDFLKVVEDINLTKVKIAIVGKYFKTGDFTLLDAYISVIESIKYACWYNKVQPEIHWLNSEEYEKNPSKVRELKNYHGVVVPGGFGSRGVEGKIRAIEYCRKNNIPYFGLCLGMQLACIEFARNVCKIKDATSGEFNPKAKNKIIDIMPDQKVLLKEKKYGGTMRLGEYACKIKKGTIAFSAYKKELIYERHRHRYEFNNDYLEVLSSKGMVFSGINPEKNLVEIIELKNHPFFVGVQFHPEFKSRPIIGHPLYNEFIKVAKAKLR
ncbi:CTP synthase [bacterium HR34]|nr:CTP synthase [bacterium HR34]